MNKWRRNLYLLLGIACITVFAFLIYKATQVETGSENYYFFSSCALAAALSLFSIHFSNLTLENFYNFKSIGIKSARADSKRRDSSEDQHYHSFIDAAKRQIIISGVTLSEWFVRDEFHRKFLGKLHENASVTFLLLDSDSSNFTDRQREDGEVAGNRTIDRYISTLEFLVANFDSLAPHISNGRLQILFYSSEPISLLVFDEVLIWDIYLPRVKNKRSPRIYLEKGGNFSEVVYSALSDVMEKARGTSGCAVKSMADIQVRLENLKKAKAHA